MKKTKWIIYTVVIGLMPFIIRLFVFLLSKEKSWNILSNSIDFVFFGLVLNLTNLNELDNEKSDQLWKTKFTGYSVIQIVIFSSILGILYFSEQFGTEVIDNRVTLFCSIALGLVSFLISNAVFTKLNSTPHENR